MATLAIDPNAIQLFSTSPLVADGSSLAFRTDNVKNSYNRLAVWFKGSVGGGVLTLQTLKPGIDIGDDIEADWISTQDILISPDEFNIDYFNGWNRLNLTGSTSPSLEAFLRRTNN